jgi:hypothetical protein
MASFLNGQYGHKILYCPWWAMREEAIVFTRILKDEEGTKLDQY